MNPNHKQHNQVIIPKLIDYGKDFINTLLLVLDQYHQVDSEVFFWKVK